jgi:hypothetical protein
VIIFVDDKQKNLEDVEHALKVHYPNIQFVGIEYQGALMYAPQEMSAQAFETFWGNMANEAKRLLAKSR